MSVEEQVQHVILKHYAMYYSGVTADEIARLGKISVKDVDTGLAALIADAKIEAFPRHGEMKYYPLEKQRAEHFTMETPEEAAGMEG